MSHTKDSHTTRIQHDNYPTPGWVTRRLLETGCLPTAGTWLEPCAGDGAIIKEVLDIFPSVRMAAIELREECKPSLAASGAYRVGTGSYLETPVNGASVIISNPPFSLAEAIVRKALSEAPNVAMLLSLSWVKAAKRAAWLRATPPDRYDVPQPVCFVQCLSCAGGVMTPEAMSSSCGWESSALPNTLCPKQCPTCGGKVRRSNGDMVGYGWYVWGPERNRSHGEYHILPYTELSERKVA